MKGGNCALKVADADVNGGTSCEIKTKTVFLIDFKFKVTKCLAQHKQV